MRALGGALLRADDGSWSWAGSGEAEPRVRDLRLIDLAPNYRCITYGNGACYVEVPREWRGEVRDPDVRDALDPVMREHAKAGDIFAERAAVILDDHRVSRRGFLLPVEEWDRALKVPCGASWDKVHEASILARARTRSTWDGETDLDASEEGEP